MSFIERIAALFGFERKRVLELSATRDGETIADADEQVLKLLAGAQFAPGVTVVLPSGRELTGEETRALSAFYAPDAEEPRRPS